LAFERFYRAESARNQSGAGLGLWLSQSLAHALGTEVVMQTEPEKISFTLVLPCQ
jgi:signal transduction histidine kinase